MHFVKMPGRADQFDPSPVQVAILWRLCCAQYRFQKRGRSGTPFFLTDRDLASQVGCSTRSVWLCKKFWRDNGVIRYWVGDKNRTYYVVQFDVPKKSKYPLPAKHIDRSPQNRSGKTLPLKDLIPPPFSPPQ